MNKLIKRIKQWFCSHEFNTEVVKYYNTNPICWKCGKPLFK